MLRRMLAIYRLAKSESRKQGCKSIDIFERALNEYASRSKRSVNLAGPKPLGRKITLTADKDVLDWENA